MTRTSKLRMLVAAILASGGAMSACGQTYYTPGYSYQQPMPPPPVVYAAPPVAAVPQAAVAPKLTDAQLDDLLGPIALYPDPLLAQVLPAATYPVDVVLAQRWLVANPAPDEASIAAQGWDASVKAMVHYPDVLQMMSDHLDWTQALGAAFLNQQADVMESIQRLRYAAQTAGTLQNNQQQQILPVDNAIEILPTNPDVIYVPVYDPQIVYVAQPVYVDAPQCIVFGVGVRVGRWLDHDFDWGHRWIAVGGGWHEGWQHDDHGWHRDAANWPGDGRGDHSPVAVTRAWARDTRKPAPVMPAAMARPNTYPDHRGYAPVAPAGIVHPTPLPIAVPRPAVGRPEAPHGVQPNVPPTHVEPSRPGPGGPPAPGHVETPRPVGPAPTPVGPGPGHVETPHAVPTPPAPAPGHVEPARPTTPAPAPVAPPAHVDTVHPAPVPVAPARPTTITPTPAPVTPAHVEPPHPTPAPVAPAHVEPVRPATPTITPAPPAPGPVAPAHVETPHAVTPPAPAHVEAPHAAPAAVAAPQPAGVFGQYQNRTEVQRSVDRAQESRPGISPLTPAVTPAPTPAPAPASPAAAPGPANNTGGRPAGRGGR